MEQEWVDPHPFMNLLLYRCDCEQHDPVGKQELCLSMARLVGGLFD